MQTTLLAGKKVRDEHLSLLEASGQLDRSLDRLGCYSEVYFNLGAADEVRYSGRQLIEQLPRHCRHEETSLLNRVSDVSPELTEFCRQMKAEHVALLERLADLRAALEDFDKAEDLCEAVTHLKQEGKELTHYLRCHVAREEEELSGFL